MNYTNPIIPGFYPDPSICRVGMDYYLVTSSFEYFPGVPIFHSRDLIHWEQIGHCLTRASQLPLEKAGSSQGIFAPTIRHHAGTFYMITTNVTVGKHFYVTSTHPAGEWSDPIWIDQPGIDPSLFFDNDGAVYFTWTQQGGIQQSQIDITTGQLLNVPRLIWTGTGGRYPEAPHLYRINGLYYLMIAEGGTEYGHMETIARSTSPWGPFEPCPHNPILTHRNQGAHIIQGTGHADLVQSADGQWWTVFLAFRQAKQYRQYHHLGRETFLAPVSWDEAGWPLIDPIELTMNANIQPVVEWPSEPIRDDFEGKSLKYVWNFLRNPHPDSWSLVERPGWLRLKGAAVTLDNAASPTFVGRRQQQFLCKVATLLEFDPQREQDEAGLTVLMNETHHYELAVVRESEGLRVIVRRRIGDLIAIVARQPIDQGEIILQIDANAEFYTFSYSRDKEHFQVLATASTQYLSSEVAGGFTGVYFGLYATGNGKLSRSNADFDWFDYS